MRFHPIHRESPFVLDNARAVASVELQNLQDHAREAVVQVVPYGGYLLPVVASFEDGQVAMVRHVSPVMREQGTPIVRAALVVVLEDLDVGQPEGLEQLPDDEPVQPSS